jgi:AbrB family looped-hinge helix DNA binding protein
MRITTKGQVTIPQAIREQAGLLPNTEVEFVLDGDLVYLVKADSPRKPTRGALLVEHLRRHGSSLTMSTEELMALTRGDEP